jgi:hypothetical protein
VCAAWGGGGGQELCFYSLNSLDFMALQSTERGERRQVWARNLKIKAENAALK